MAKLEDKEKQEIIGCLQADRPLPEKYHFLLFGDKREVELIWNGKSGNVSNVVLPFQTIFARLICHPARRIQKIQIN